MRSLDYAALPMDKRKQAQHKFNNKFWFFGNEGDEDQDIEYRTQDIRSEVRCERVEDMKKFAELVGQTVTPTTKYIWYPEVKAFPNRFYRYVDEK